MSFSIVSGPLTNFGLFIKNGVLDLANILVGEAAPGLVFGSLFVAAGAVLAWMWWVFGQRSKALEDLSHKLGGYPEKGNDALKKWEGDEGGNKACKAVKHAWKMFDNASLDEASSKGEAEKGDDTQKKGGSRIFIRPAEFFNQESLGFRTGIFRIFPGIFVSLGLACTFLGLIAALQDMASKSGMDDHAMQRLLNIASAKFIMSLGGLVCSIVLTIALRRFSVCLEKKILALCSKIEDKCPSVSLEEIGSEQLRQLEDIRKHGQKLATDLAAAMGEQMKTTLPEVMTQAFTVAINPLLEQVGRKEQDGIASFSEELSRKLSGSVEEALSRAGEKLSAAAEQMERLLGRMDTSSGQMGTAMEGAVARLGKAVEGLQGNMGETTRIASKTLNQGTEQLLAVMNRTLEGIRDNTAKSTKAMSETAQNLQTTVDAMRVDMEKTLQSGTEEARARMEAAGNDAGQSITQAGQSVMGSFEQTGNAIARLGSELSEKAGKELLAPMTEIAGRLAGFVDALESGSSAMRRSADAVNDGAQAGSTAASTFREAAQGLVEAASPIRITSERMESSLHHMADTTRNAVDIVTESSRSIAEGTSRALQSAEKILDTERRGIETAIREFGDVTKQTIGRMNELLAGMGEQYGRIDDIDKKLGGVFEQYKIQVEVVVNTIAQKVREMSGPLEDSVKGMQSIVDQYQNFSPEQGRR